MRHLLAALFSVALIIGSAHAAAPSVLKAGDQIDLVDGDTFTVWRLRKTLREYGYYGFTQGDHTGRIIKITAYGPDKKRYRLKVRSTTGEVTQAYILQRLF